MMGKPDDLQGYREITIHDLHIYIDKSILGEIDEHNKVLRFVVEGYGWFRVPIDSLLTEE